MMMPTQGFKYTDEGWNTQRHPKECLEAALAQNEQIKSNTDMMKKCKSLLVQEFSKVFPEDTAKYSGIWERIV